MISNRTGAEERDTYVVPIGVHSLGVEALLSLLLACFYVLADPDVPIQPEDEVHAAGQRDKMRLQSPDENGGNGHKLPISQLDR